MALGASAFTFPAAAGAQVVVHQTPGTTMQGRTFFHGGMFPHRLQPGFIVPPFWFGPQFQISNWQMYGFAPPPRRHRWVRYYDDAYMIDGDGRIVDSRYGMDWDRYGERWDMADGIPAYHGRNDWRPGERDYEWAERYRRDHGDEDWDYADRGEDYGPRPGYGPPQGYGPPPGYGPPQGACGAPQPCAPAYPAGYGYYGWGVAYPMVIETTVVTGGCGCGYEIVTEEVVEVRERPRHRVRHRPRVRHAPPPPPPPGERG